LRGFELATGPLASPGQPVTIAAGGFALDSAFLFPGTTETALDPDLLSGAWTHCCMELAVSAGEVLSFSVPQIAAAVASATGGGHLRHGSPDQDHDLVFKAFIDPDNTLSDIAPLNLRSGLGAVRLDWTASPGAQRYDVSYRAPGDPTFQAAGSTRQPWFVDVRTSSSGPRFYSVTAVGTNGSVSTTSILSAAPLPEHVAAQSLGDGPASSATACQGGELAQTFTVETAGRLVGIELGTETPYTGSFVEVLDANDVRLADANPLSSGRGQIAPLDPILPGASSGFFDLSSSNVNLNVGDRLKIVVHGGGSPCVSLRDSVDAYAGGEEWRDGVPQPDRDLAFRVLVE